MKETEQVKVKPLKIDLRGKSLEEVAKLLRDNGFKVSVSLTDMWDKFEIANGAREEGYVGPPVHVIWIDAKEAPSLTVINYKGEYFTLSSGFDLHLFDRPPTGPAGQDWQVIRTLTVLK